MKYESRRLDPWVNVAGSMPKMSWRSGPTYAYEWSTGVVAWMPATRGTDGRIGDDVGAERQLRVDAGLLVVCRREETELDAESQ